MQLLQARRQQVETAPPDELSALRAQREQAAKQAATANAALLVARQQVLNNASGAAERVVEAQRTAIALETSLTNLDLQIAELQNSARYAGAEREREGQIASIINLAFTAQSSESEYNRLVKEGHDLLVEYANKILDARDKLHEARTEFRQLIVTPDPAPGTGASREAIAEERGASLEALRRKEFAWPDHGVLGGDVANAVNRLSLLRHRQSLTRPAKDYWTR